MRAWVVCLVGLAAVGSSAAAAEITDDGMRLDLGDEPHCVFFPKELQVPADCPGVNLDAAASAMESAFTGADPELRAKVDMKMVAAVRWMSAQGQPIMLIIISGVHMDPTIDTVGNLLAGMYDSTHDGKRSKDLDPASWLTYTRTTVAGTPGVRQVFDFDQKLQGRAVVYLLYGARRMEMIMFMGPGAVRAEVDATATRVLSRLTMPELTDKQRKEAEFGLDMVDQARHGGRAEKPKSAAYRAGEIFAYVVMAGAAVGFVIYLVNDRRRRRAT
jgi:hypothetical protein